MRTLATHAFVLATAAVTTSYVAAQAPPTPPPSAAAATEPLAFEVASVKPNKSGQPFVRIGGGPAGRYEATNVPLRLLIRNAYQLQDHQIVNAPGWIDSDRFDIVAKAPEGSITPQPPGSGPGPIQRMVQALLADRFKLVVHRETRELPIYAMVLARSDGKLGPAMRLSTTDCAAVFAGRGRGGGPVPPPQPGEPVQCGLMVGPGNLRGGALQLGQFAQTLSSFVGRTVVDKTGLTGNYDVTLTYTPEQLPQGPPPPGITPPVIDPNGPSIFTAMQEQLGLKLDSQRGPVEVLVIDRVEQPTED